MLGIIDESVNIEPGQDRAIFDANKYLCNLKDFSYAFGLLIVIIRCFSVSIKSALFPLMSVLQE